MGPIFNEKVAKKWNLWVHEQYIMYCLRLKSQHLRLLFIEQYMNSNRISPKRVKKKKKKKKKNAKRKRWNADVLSKLSLIMIQPPKVPKISEAMMRMMGLGLVEKAIQMTNHLQRHGGCKIESSVREFLTSLPISLHRSSFYCKSWCSLYFGEGIQRYESVGFELF